MVVLEVLKIPFSRAIPWYGAQSVPMHSLQPFRHAPGPDGDFLLGCLKTPDPASPASSETCVLYLHGFPDQSVDHRKRVSDPNDDCSASSYGTFSTRMSNKLSESFDTFCAFNFSGSPGSTSDRVSFFDKTVTQEVWDVLNVMSYLSHEASVGTSGFHVVGLSTGAIVGSLLRGVSDELRRQLDLPPILSIAVIAACGATSMDTALGFDFDESQQKDFDALGYCWKQFWLPRNEPNNPPGAVLPEQEAGDSKDDDDPGRWVPHRLKLGRQYRDDFLQLPILSHLRESQGGDSGGRSIPLLVVHGGADRNVPLAEGRAVYEAAHERKRWVEIPRGNHLLTNSKDLKKAIRAIREWHTLCEEEEDVPIAK